jgi:hypothetical protein
MIDHEKHLRDLLQNQRSLSTEIQELTNLLNARRDQFNKQQGIIEYLTANGIRPEENEIVEEPQQ